MFATPWTRDSCARLPSVCVEPWVVEIGVARSASTESTSYCGVCTATRYCTPRLSIQYDGATTPLDDSDTSTSVATLVWFSPACCASARSISTLSCGAVDTCAR